ncbi:Proline iminopeptidase [Linum perenne]
MMGLFASANSSAILLPAAVASSSSTSRCSSLPSFSLHISSSFLSPHFSIGRKKIVARVRNLNHNFEQELLGEVMESGKNDPQDLNRSLYPALEPYDTGFLKVSDVHSIYYEQSGNPTGHVDIASCSQSSSFTVVLEEELHQAIEGSLIQSFTESFSLIRFNFYLVFGGSWGSTLSLAYSQSHPDKVTGLVLRGIFLLRKKEIDWFYEGGAAAIFPDAWEPFRDLIPEDERGSFVNAYSKRLNSDDIETQYAAARAWTKWEMMTSYLVPDEDTIKKGDNDMFSLAFARIENHYFMNKGFFLSDSYLLDNVDKIRHINTTIVQGRYDVCCPMMSAWDLHKAWPEAEFKIVKDAGHSANEPGTTAELVAANERLKNILRNKT